MPPRNRRVEEVYENEQMVRLQQTVENLANQMAAMQVQIQQQQDQRNPRHVGSRAGSRSNSSSSDENEREPPRGHHRREARANEAGSNRWEMGLRVDIPEFHGGLQAEELIDWLVAVEEVFEFKDVPENKRVALIATRFRERAAAWWHQLKKKRARQGKRKIDTWDKLKKHLREAFLPHNYERMMYQKVQNLRQGAKSVDEYTTEFYQLLARNDLGETEDQTVSRYIGGLQIQYQDALNLIDLYSVSEAHQKALQLEKQSKRRSSGSA